MTSHHLGKGSRTKREQSPQEIQHIKAAFELMNRDLCAMSMAVVSITCTIYLEVFLQSGVRGKLSPLKEPLKSFMPIVQTMAPAKPFSLSLWAH